MTQEIQLKQAKKVFTKHVARILSGIEIALEGKNITNLKEIVKQVKGNMWLCYSDTVDIITEKSTVQLD